MMTMTFHYKDQEIREIPLSDLHKNSPCVVVNEGSWTGSQLVLHFESPEALHNFAVALDQISTDLVCRNCASGHPINPAPVPDEAEIPFLGVPMPHTAGPWRRGDDLIKGGRVHAPPRPNQATEHDCLICTLVHYPNGEQLANANLIAAAPDLLSACESALHALEDSKHACLVQSELRQAIAKAKGGEYEP